MPQAHGTRRRHEGLRILGIDSALDRMPADFYVALRERQFFPGCDQQLRLDDVNAGDQFGHGVLDLHAGVHLYEEELVVLIEEFERSGIAVADFTAGARAALAHDLALLGGKSGRRRLLDDFLVPALHRAVALAEVHDVAVIVRNNLEFDVPRLLEKLLHVDLVIAEGCQRLGFGHADSARERCVRVDDAHAAPAAAAGCLDDHRIADVLGDAQVLVHVGAQGTIRARHARHARSFHDLDRRDFVAHQTDGFRARSDINEPAFLDPFGKVCIFGQEPVARMDGTGVSDLGGADDGRHV